jgi:microcin C transport system permease protein
VPGGPVEQKLMEMRGFGGEQSSPQGNANTISEQQREELEKAFGFDKPLIVRYYNWLIRDCVGLRMKSYMYTDKTAWQLIRKRFPVSLTFGLSGFLLSYLICIPVGIAKALKHGSVFDFTSSMTVFIAYSIPAFALGMLLKMLLCGTTDGLFDIFPISGYQSDNFASMSSFGKFKDVFTHMFLPVLCYVAGNFAVLTMLMKNSLLDQVGKDYMRTVIATGVHYKTAVWKHALRNSLIPIATGFGSILTLIFASSVIIERVFEIPGMGRLSLTAITSRDYAVFMGILSLTSIFGLLGNILSDLCYVIIDPRINFEK